MPPSSSLCKGNRSVLLAHVLVPAPLNDAVLLNYLPIHNMDFEVIKKNNNSEPLSCSISHFPAVSRQLLIVGVSVFPPSRIVFAAGLIKIMDCVGCVTSNNYFRILFTLRETRRQMIFWRCRE
jgi:hypothetical protein